MAVACSMDGQATSTQLRITRMARLVTAIWLFKANMSPSCSGHLSASQVHDVLRMQGKPSQRPVKSTGRLGVQNRQG